MLSSNRILTVDIGAATVKLAEFDLRGGGLVLKRYGFAPLPAEAAHQEMAVVNALRGLMQEHHLKSAPTVISVAGQSVFSRFIKCPPVPPEKLYQIVQYEAQQNVPFPINEVVWDYQQLERNDDEIHVMLTAIKAEMVEAIAHSVEMAGLDPDLLDVAPLALGNVVRKAFPDEKGCVLIADVGARSTDLVFMEGANVFLRSIPVAGNTVTQQVARELELEPAEAEALKLEYAAGTLAAGEKADKVQAAVQATVARLLAEINRSINFYRTQQSGNRPEKILLAGGAARMPGLVETLAAKGGVPVELLDASAAFSIDEKLDAAQVKADLHQLGELVGCALRKVEECPLTINLMPERIVKAQAFKRKQPWFAMSAAALIGILLAWGGYFGRVAGLKQQELEGVSGRVQALEQIEPQLRVLEQKVAMLLHYENRLMDTARARGFWLHLLDRVRAATPEGMSLSAVEPMVAVANGAEQVTGFRISGFGYLDKIKSEAAVREYWEALKTLEDFSEQSKIVRQPAPGLFSAEFVMELMLKEPFAL